MSRKEPVATPKWVNSSVRAEVFRTGALIMQQFYRLQVAESHTHTL